MDLSLRLSGGDLSDGRQEESRAKALTNGEWMNEEAEKKEKKREKLTKYEISPLEKKQRF
jgi:hypothetical protein